MTDETTDLNWKTRGLAVWAWCVKHPETMWILLAVFLGFIAGKLL